ncbi:MAG: hypothetical protein QXS02_03535 [Candidatus Thermoplasmatota archaeon]
MKNKHSVMRLTEEKQFKKEFLDKKEQSLLKLEKAYMHDMVDEGISRVLRMINSYDEYYTSSSCSGRVLILEIPLLGDKKNARVLGKWHVRVNAQDVLDSVKKAEKGMIWLLSQSPILHIGCSSLKAANTLVKLAVSSGFKNSTVKSTGKRITVELSSTERLDAPLGKDGVLFCDQKYIELLVDISNMIIERSNKKIRSLEKRLETIR